MLQVLLHGLIPAEQVQENLLAEGAGGEHLGDEIEGPLSNIDPGGMVSDDGLMVEGAK